MRGCRLPDVARAGDRLMTGVALAILTIIAIGVATAGIAGS